MKKIKYYLLELSTLIFAVSALPTITISNV